MDRDENQWHEDLDDYDADEPGALRCVECRRPLTLGMDAIALQRGVIGARGHVRLQEKLVCSDTCARAYFGNHEPPE